jgi:hypothetical protein
MFSGAKVLIFFHSANYWAKTLDSFADLLTSSDLFRLKAAQVSHHQHLVFGSTPKFIAISAASTLSLWHTFSHHAWGVPMFMVRGAWRSCKIEGAAVVLFE